MYKDRENLEKVTPEQTSKDSFPNFPKPNLPGLKSVNKQIQNLKNSEPNSNEKAQRDLDNISMSSINSAAPSLVSMTGGNNSLVQDEDENVNIGFGILSNKMPNSSKYKSRVHGHSQGHSHGQKPSNLVTSNPSNGEKTSKTSVISDSGSRISASGIVKTAPIAPATQPFLQKEQPSHYWSPNTERINDLRNRNQKTLPHLRSSYPVETQGRSPARVETNVPEVDRKASVDQLSNVQSQIINQNNANELTPKIRRSNKTAIKNSILSHEEPISVQNVNDADKENIHKPLSIPTSSNNIKKPEAFVISPPKTSSNDNNSTGTNSFRSEKSNNSNKNGNILVDQKKKKRTSLVSKWVKKKL